MEGFYAAMVLIGIFVLRLGVPILITGAVVYGLHKLDARWEAEAQATLKQPSPEAAVVLRPVEVPCWVLRKCPEQRYSTCPAYLHSELPCWLARRQAEGILPHKCVQCTEFRIRKPTYELVK